MSEEIKEAKNQQEASTAQVGLTNEKDLMFLTKFFSLNFIYCLITQRKLHSLDQTLQTYASSATPELVQKAGITIDDVPDEVFAFSSHKHFIAGSVFLNKKVAKFKNTKFTSLCIPPVLFSEALKAQNARVFHVDLGSNTAHRFGKDALKEIVRIPGLVSLAGIGGLFLLQDYKKFAVPMEMEGGEYVLAFLEEEDGKSTIEGLVQAGQEGVNLAYNKFATLVKGLAYSPYSGLIINPATDAQVIIEKEDLQRLVSIIQALKGPSIFSKDGIKELFKLHRT
jgi:hypothetical protein